LKKKNGGGEVGGGEGESRLPLLDGDRKSIDSLGSGCRASVVNGSPRLMKGVGGGRNDGRTRMKEEGRRRRMRVQS